MRDHPVVLYCLLLLYAVVYVTSPHEVSKTPVHSCYGGTSHQAKNLSSPAVIRSFLYQRLLRKAAQKRAGNLQCDALFLINLVHLQSGDLELNPGPHTQKFPCGSCCRGVTSRSRGIQCDGCDTLFHIRCIGMESKEYKDLGNCSAVWLCNNCGLLNISPTISHYDIEVSNTFEPLGQSHNSSSSFSETFSNIGEPSHTSSPQPKDSGKRKPDRQMLKILNVNCQSLPAKRESFFCLIEEQKPDIIVGTESWLSSHHSDNECFPTDHYTVIRRDRGGNVRGGGVFIAAKNDLIVVREDTLETNCEILWCSLKLASSKTLFIGAYYRPHEGDAESLAELQLSLSRLNMQHLILLAGDFNFPGWKWSTLEVQNCNYPALHHQFGDMLDDNGLSQLVEEPTRNNNTLDLVLTNNPTLVSEVYVVPGISDHDCPVINLKNRVNQRKKKPRRSVPQYGKAKWGQFSKYMEALGEEITTQQNVLTADGMWRMFADGIHNGIKEFIPHKMVKVGSHLPWFTQDLKTLHNRRDRLAKKKRLLTKNNQPISDCLNTKLKSIKKDMYKRPGNLTGHMRKRSSHQIVRMSTKV